MRKGFSSLALALIVIAVLGVIGGGFAFLYNSQQAISRAELRGSQSFFAAEAGINEAVSKYKGENPLYSLSDPKWFYGAEATSLSIPWSSSFLPDHDLLVNGSITFRVENFKLYEKEGEVYFYVEGVLKEGGRTASRFPLALRLAKAFLPQGESLGVEAGIGVGEVVIMRGGEIWRRLSEEGYRGGQALERAFTLVGGGGEYEIVLGPGLYLVPMKRQGNYCYALDLEGRKSVVLRSAKGWGPKWVKVVGIIPYKSSPNVTDPLYWSTIYIRNGAELRIEDLWISPPIERKNIEREVLLQKDISAVLIDDVDTRLVVKNCIFKNRDVVAYKEGSLSGIRVLLSGKGSSELSVSKTIFDAGSFLDYKEGSKSYALRVSNLSGGDVALEGEITDSVFLNHDVAIANDVTFGSLTVNNSLFWNNKVKASGNVNIVNPIEEDPQFKSFYSFLSDSKMHVEWFRHWDSYVPQEGSALERRGIGLTSSYWNSMVPVPRGGEILLVMKIGDSYRLLRLNSADEALNALQSYYASFPYGSSILVFGRGFWYLTKGYEFKSVGSFMMISTWGPIFTPFFVFSPTVWESPSASMGVLRFNDALDVKIYGFYFGLAGGKGEGGDKVFMSFSNVSNLEVADCVFKRVYGGMGKVIELKLDNCSSAGVYNNIFDHEYRKVASDLSGVPALYDVNFIDTVPIQYNGRVSMNGNLFWGEGISSGHNDVVSPQEERNFFLDGSGRVIKSPFNPFSYRLNPSNSNRYLEGNFDGGDMGIRADLYPYIRYLEGDDTVVRLENQIEKFRESRLDRLLSDMGEGETLLLGEGTFSIENELSTLKDGVGVIGVWGPYYSRVNLRASLSLIGANPLLFGLGFNAFGSFPEGSMIHVAGVHFSLKDVFLKVADVASSWRYAIQVSSTSGMVKNVLINGGYVEGNTWLAKVKYGLYVSGGSVVIDHVNSLKHDITGIKWSNFIYGCNSYASGVADYDPPNVGMSNLSVDPQGDRDAVCYPFDSLCYWWNNGGEANTGSCRGIDWANLPISPK